MKRIIKYTFLSIIVAGVSFTSGIGGAFVGIELFYDENNEITTQTVTQQDIQVIQEESAIINVADETSNSVVSVIITQEVQRFFNPLGGARGQTEEQQVGAGSGFVISADGLIVTNRHVVDVEDASYTVVFANGDQYEAQVLARDTLLDIAFLQIDAENLVPLDLGASEELQVGQTVVAVGNALGEFSNTVSSGIISGLSRDIVASDASGFNSEEINNLIQTDASINPGNSGGPLLDIQGNVIGVNVAVAQSAENIGFAIPIDDVKDLIDRLNEDGSIDRPVLGVRYRLITEQFAENNDIPVTYGALLIPGLDETTEPAVLPGSPAENAGLDAFDIILEIDGTRIDTDNTLQEIIQNKRFGDEVDIVYLRDEQEFTTEVELEQF